MNASTNTNASKDFRNQGTARVIMGLITSIKRNIQPLMTVKVLDSKKSQPLRYYYNKDTNDLENYNELVEMGINILKVAEKIFTIDKSKMPEEISCDICCLIVLLLENPGKTEIEKFVCDKDSKIPLKEQQKIKTQREKAREDLRDVFSFFMLDGTVSFEPMCIEKISWYCDYEMVEIDKKEAAKKRFSKTYLKYARHISER